jgi:hypothetical protein
MCVCVCVCIYIYIYIYRKYRLQIKWGFNQKEKPLYIIGQTPLENDCLLSRILTMANLNNHINKRCLVMDFSIVEVLTSIAR